MTVILSLPHKSVSEGPSHGTRRASPNVQETSIANDRYVKHQQVQATHVLAERLSYVVDENRIKVASGTLAWHPGTVIMDTGILVRSDVRQLPGALQVKFDLASNGISLISGGRAIDFDIKRSAPRTMMKLARVGEMLREENKLGGRAKEVLDTKVLSGAFHERMAPARQVHPAKLADGGYEFQLEAPGKMTRRDGSELQITGTVTIQTDCQGRATRFMSAVSTDDRVLAGSKRCSGPHITYISDRETQNALQGVLRDMFPKEYKNMVSR